MKTFKPKLGAVALSIFTSLHLFAADVTGDWKAEFDTQIGAQKYTYHLKQDGEKITGKANSDIGGEKREVELKDGKIAGDQITFYETFDYQGNSIRIDYTGKIAGDEIKFTRKVGDFATEELVAKRVKDESAAAGFDAAKLVGTWTYVSGEKDGANLDKDHFAGQKATFTDKEIKVSGPNGEYDFTYKLDTKKLPVAITMEMTAGGGGGDSKAAGIIALDGNNLKLCYPPRGGAAPTKFEAPSGSGLHYFVFERASDKAAAK
ncbi:TIGR03067 domain-containing protein [bacterium]|nr:TIGR03067 domain-containing protein [bacterium]